MTFTDIMTKTHKKIHSVCTQLMTRLENQYKTVHMSIAQILIPMKNMHKQAIATRVGGKLPLRLVEEYWQGQLQKNHKRKYITTHSGTLICKPD